jgi:hypothetical protein
VEGFQGTKVEERSGEFGSLGVEEFWSSHRKAVEGALLGRQKVECRMKK